MNTCIPSAGPRAHRYCRDIAGGSSPLSKTMSSTRISPSLSNTRVLLEAILVRAWNDHHTRLMERTYSQKGYFVVTTCQKDLKHRAQRPWPVASAWPGWAVLFTGTPVLGVPLDGRKLEREQAAMRERQQIAKKQAALASLQPRLNAPASPVKPSPIEKHYTVGELAERWHLSPKTVRRWFEEEEDVLCHGSPTTRARRGYWTMRIPESVMNRVYQKHLGRLGET
jgi:AraC-like DNA-binding protein